MFPLFKRAGACFLLFIFTVLVSGCGETVRGAGRDVQRIGRGIRTIFISD